MPLKNATYYSANICLLWKLKCHLQRTVNNMTPSLPHAHRKSPAIVIFQVGCTYAKSKSTKISLTYEFLFVENNILRYKKLTWWYAITSYFSFLNALEAKEASKTKSANMLNCKSPRTVSPSNKDRKWPISPKPQC